MAPEVNSLFLRGSGHARRRPRQLFYTGFAGINAPRAVFRTIAFTQNGQVYTEDASAELFLPGNLDIICTIPLFCSICSCAQSPLVIFWEPSTTKSSSLSRARGWRGRRESDSQVTCHQLVSQLWTYTLLNTRLTSWSISWTCQCCRTRMRWTWW